MERHGREGIEVKKGCSKEHLSSPPPDDPLSISCVAKDFSRLEVTEMEKLEEGLALIPCREFQGAKPAKKKGF